MMWVVLQGQERILHIISIEGGCLPADHGRLGAVLGLRQAVHRDGTRTCEPATPLSHSCSLPWNEVSLTTCSILCRE